MRTIASLPPRAAAFVAAVILALAAVPASAAGPRVGPRPQAVEDRYVPDPPGVKVQDWVTGLRTPWSLVFLPDGRALVSERGGRIRFIDRGTLLPGGYEVPEVAAGGEGGLMGLALHPRFPSEPYVYAMHTTDAGGRRSNRVVRLRLEGQRLAPDRVVLGGIPASTYHNGGRIAFGPDGMLWIGTGETGHPELAQDPRSLGGKLLHVTPDGKPAPDNPDPGSPVWSLGHRNIQGIAWMRGVAEPFLSEHGPSGEFGLHAYDEINAGQRGGNFGWPRVVGAPHDPRYVDPVVAWPRPTTPPSGMAFWGGRLMVATLRSEALLAITLERGPGGRWQARAIERWFTDADERARFGRLRDAVVGPDGALYVLTNGRDGGDRILRLARQE